MADIDFDLMSLIERLDAAVGPKGLPFCGRCGRCARGAPCQLYQELCDGLKWATQKMAFQRDTNTRSRNAINDLSEAYDEVTVHNKKHIERIQSLEVELTDCQDDLREARTENEDLRKRLVSRARKISELQELHETWHRMFEVMTGGSKTVTAIPTQEVQLGDDVCVSMDWLQKHRAEILAIMVTEGEA